MFLWALEKIMHDDAMRRNIVVEDRALSLKDCRCSIGLV